MPANGTVELVRPLQFHMDFEDNSHFELRLDLGTAMEHFSRGSRLAGKLVAFLTPTESHLVIIVGLHRIVRHLCFRALLGPPTGFLHESMAHHNCEQVH